MSDSISAKNEAIRNATTLEERLRAVLDYYTDMSTYHPNGSE